MRRFGSIFFADMAWHCYSIATPLIQQYCDDLELIRSSQGGTIWRFRLSHCCNCDVWHSCRFVGLLRYALSSLHLLHPLPLNAWPPPEGVPLHCSSCRNHIGMAANSITCWPISILYIPWYFRIFYDIFLIKLSKKNRHIQAPNPLQWWSSSVHFFVFCSPLPWSL